MERNRELPSDHAFVVQFRAHASGTADQLEGRVEHLVSGQPAHFGSAGELLRFIEQTLGGVRPKAS
jgi:hypothetical protein